MSDRRGRRPSSRPRSKRNALFPLLAAIGIGALVLGLIVSVLPAIFGGGSGNSSSNSNNTVQVTPGAQEATMRARLQQNPKDVDAMIVLADLLANSGRGTEAIQWFNKAIQLKPNDLSLRVDYGTVLMQYNYDFDAELEFKKAHELNPSDPQPLYLLGQLYEHETPPHPDQALSMYAAAATVQPDSVYANLANDRIAALKSTPGVGLATPGATP